MNQLDKQAALEYLENGQFYSDYDETCKHLKTIRECLTAPEPITERQALFNAVDRMGWDEIDAYHAELREGQAMNEDAGGFFMRCIKRLFGIVPRNRDGELVTYRKAMEAMIKEDGR